MVKRIKAMRDRGITGVTITRLGRERPVLYRGEFNIPKKLINRLAIAKTCLILAGAANYNARVDQLYLAVDNTISAVIIAKESTLTTRNHRTKIEKFFHYLKKRANARSLEKTDFTKFYKLWLRSRYHLYLPKWSEVYEMRLFTSHLFGFAVTEIARLCKSDETILEGKISELIRIHNSEAIREYCEELHQKHEIEAEEDGEKYGNKLERKLLNPWNFVNVSLLSDETEIARILDSSDEVQTLLRQVLRSLDKLVERVQWENFVQIGTSIANARPTHSKVERTRVLDEAIEAAATHPEFLKFRLMFSFDFDSSNPKETLSMFDRIFLQTLGKESLHGVPKTGWEQFKASKKPVIRRTRTKSTVRRI